jgi:hypothetical protein
MKILFFSLFIACLSTSFAQNFSSYSDVLVYTSGKVFQNSQGNVKISINENGIQVNGNNEYFNIEISVISSTVAIIKGQSLRNADGTISMRLNSSTGCIYQDGESYCAVVRPTSIVNSSTPTNNYSEDIKTFIQKTPFSVNEKSRGRMPFITKTIKFESNGTGTYTESFGSNEVKQVTWKVSEDKYIDIYSAGKIFMKNCKITYDSHGSVGIIYDNGTSNISMYQN